MYAINGTNGINETNEMNVERINVYPPRSTPHAFLDLDITLNLSLFY